MELFACYSLNLRNYIMQQGIRYKIVGLNPTTKKPFWVFIKTEELLNCLTEWSLMSPEK